MAAYEVPPLKWMRTSNWAAGLVRACYALHPAALVACIICMRQPNIGAEFGRQLIEGRDVGG